MLSCSSILSYIVSSTLSIAVFVINCFDFGYFCFISIQQQRILGLLDLIDAANDDEFNAGLDCLSHHSLRETTVDYLDVGTMPLDVPSSASWNSVSKRSSVLSYSGSVDDGPLSLRPHFSPLFEKLVDAAKVVMNEYGVDEVTTNFVRTELQKEDWYSEDMYGSDINKAVLTAYGQLDSLSEIFGDWLLLGHKWNAHDRHAFSAYGVTHVINATKNIASCFQEQGIEYHRVPVEDEDTADLKSYFNSVFNFIEQARRSAEQEENESVTSPKNSFSSSGSGKRFCVFVHCEQGVSRSAALVMAYAIRSFGWTADQALSYVQSKRERVLPNPGFMQQLLEFENEVFANSSGNFRATPEVPVDLNDLSLDPLITEVPTSPNIILDIV